MKELCGKRTSNVTGFSKTKKGKVTIEKEDILERQSEHIGDLYNYQRNEEFSVNMNIEGPAVPEMKVRNACQTNTGKESTRN